MSKVDAQRALRDARYARFAAAKKSEAAPARKSPARAPAKSTSATVRGSEAPPSSADGLVADAVEATTKVAAKTGSGTSAADSVSAAITEADPEAEPNLCGHRSMNGRSCTRTKGHEQKTHRYN